jgi:hypothetical protein
MRLILCCPKTAMTVISSRGDDNSGIRQPLLHGGDTYQVIEPVLIAIIFYEKALQRKCLDLANPRKIRNDER